jgi:hypothetical protein
MPGRPSNDPESGMVSESSLLRPEGFAFGGDGILRVNQRQIQY